jgi:hypothetical protein
MKPKFKLGDRVKFTRVAQRNTTLLAAENDPKPWYDVKWVSVVPYRVVITHPRGYGTIPIDEQQGIYAGTRTKQNGLIIATDPLGDLRRTHIFKRLASVPCGLVVTDARKSPILVLMEDLEHV